MKFLIFGGRGWIGSMLVTLLEQQGHTVFIAKSRLEDFVGINWELGNVKPDFVLNCAGITGRPTIDWSETHQQETFLVNTVGVVNLAHACWQGGYHLTNYATGCIYKYNDEHPIGTAYSELDTPNFRGSVYSTSKSIAEELLSVYDNVLTLRIRMPISDDLHPKSLVTKLIKYSKVVNIPNSATILSEMLPISLLLAQSRKTGVYNFTNPGAISHNEILALYKKHIDPSFSWNNFSEEEQNAVLKSQRSNCELDVSKLTELYPVTPIHTALESVMMKIKTV
jgi:3,5-epimerase/4-reductase